MYVTVTVVAMNGAFAHAEVPRIGWGVRYTASSVALPIVPMPGGVHVRVRESAQASLELAVDLMRAWEVEESTGPLSLAARRRRYMINFDLAQRYHLVGERHRDVYALGGGGISWEQINGEDECGEVIFNAEDGLRVRVFAGVGGEGRARLGERSLIALGIELRAIVLLLPGPAERYGPPPISTVGGQVTATLTLYK